MFLHKTKIHFKGFKKKEEIGAISHLKILF